MAREFKLSVVAPDRTVFEDNVQSLIAPGVQGYLGILADHEPVIVALKTGILEFVEASGQRAYVSISGGFLEASNNSVIVLANTAERSSEIDLARAERALEEARRALRGEATEVSREQALEELERAMNRVKAARIS